MAVGVHKITETFEGIIAEYCGAPYAVAVDNCTNALYLSLMYRGVQGVEIEIPSHTYPGVPCAVIMAGGKVVFTPSPKILQGSYPLGRTEVWDAALEFSHNMYLPGLLMCLSFSGPYKHLKLGKGGAILTDDKAAYDWLKRARNCGRNECSYHDDNFDMIGGNYYMLPEIAAKGIGLMTQFYNSDGSPKKNDDLALPYPDLSRFEIYTK